MSQEWFAQGEEKYVYALHSFDLLLGRPPPCYTPSPSHVSATTATEYYQKRLGSNSSRLSTYRQYIVVVLGVVDDVVVVRKYGHHLRLFFCALGGCGSEPCGLLLHLLFLAANPSEPVQLIRDLNLALAVIVSTRVRGVGLESGREEDLHARHHASLHFWVL